MQQAASGRRAICWSYSIYRSNIALAPIPLPRLAWNGNQPSGRKSATVYRRGRVQLDRIRRRNRSWSRAELGYLGEVAVVVLVGCSDLRKCLRWLHSCRRRVGGSRRPRMADGLAHSGVSLLSELWILGDRFHAWSELDSGKKNFPSLNLFINT